MSDAPLDVVVIGAGISGLAAALRIATDAPQRSLALLEAADRAGGVLRTELRDGFLLEHSADNFITDNPATMEFCGRLGFDPQLLPTNAEHRGTYVVCRGRLERVPDGFLLMAPARLGPVLRTPILSVPGKLRLAWERFVRRAAHAGEDESLASFARRRLGNEVFERLVQPLVGGIYTADPEQLSLRATLPRFLDMEREHGSLIRAAQAAPRREAGSVGGSASGARYNLFVAPRLGMTNLVDAAVARLPAGALRLNTRVATLRKLDEAWQIQIAGANAGTLRARAVVVALPAHQAAQLAAGFDAELFDQLRTIPYADSMIALVGYRRQQIAHPLDAFGFVVPRIEGRDILACSFSSVKFPDRAPPDHELLRVFLGGALRPEQIELDDAAVRKIVLRELGTLLGVRGEPTLFEVQRWRRAMPQYHLGHLERVKQIEELAARHPGLALAGNAYHGIGLPHCVQSGEAAGRKVISAL